MFLLLITFLKASHSFRNRLLVICKNAYLFATMIMTSVSSPDRKSGSAGMPRPISYAVFCLKKKTERDVAGELEEVAGAAGVAHVAAVQSQVLFLFYLIRRPPISTLFPYTTLFRSLLLITFLKASHSFRNRLLVICKNAYLFATMIMTSVSSPFSCCSGIVRLNLM